MEINFVNKEIKKEYGGIFGNVKCIISGFPERFALASPERREVGR